MNSLISKIFKDFAKAPLIINGESGCVVIPSTDIYFGPNIKKYQDHITCSHGYKLICVDDRYSESHKT